MTTLNLLAAGALALALGTGTAAAADRPLDTAVAKRGDATLTLGVFDARMLEIPEEHRAGYIDNGKRLEETIRQLLLMQQLANEAKAAGLDKDPRYQYQLELAATRILAVYRMEELKKVEAKGDFDALAKEAYLADKAAWRESDELALRHILVRAHVRTDADAKALAEEIRFKATSGTPFAELAAQQSDDPVSKTQGGTLPPVTKGKTELAFEEAAFALTNPDEISPVVKTRHGYHIIQLVSRKPGRQREFDEVKTEIIAKLRADQTKKLQQAHTDELNSLPMEFDPELVGELRTRFGEGPNAASAAQLPGPLPPPVEPPRR